MRLAARARRSAAARRNAEAPQLGGVARAACVDVLVDGLGVVDEVAEAAEAYGVGGHPAGSAVSWHRLAPACRVLSTLRAAGADASPPFAPRTFVTSVKNYIIAACVVLAWISVITLSYVFVAS